MFSTLESSWDRSARRGWSAAASFTLQAMALSLLLVIPMFWAQGPPRFAMASDDHRSTYAYTRRPNRSFARAPFREILSQPAERSNRDAAVYPDHNAKDQ